jgi:hypothetical protein
MTTIILIRHCGRMGNRMNQLMFARDVKKLCKQHVLIEGYDLPGWLISSAHSNQKPTITVGSHLLRAKYLAILIDSFKPACVELNWAVFRESNLTKPKDYFDLFPLGSVGSDTPDDRLLVNVRLGDVSVLSHPNYGPLPISYYQYLRNTTGLKLRFMGELDDSSYVQDLQDHFPDAEFSETRSPIEDFQTIRRAKHVAIATSSFSWLAAFLSNAQSIHVPVAGMLNPEERPDIDLLPLTDERYVFHAISRVAWSARYEDRFPPLSSYQELSATSVKSIKRSALRRKFARSIRVHLGIAGSLALSKVVKFSEFLPSRHMEVVENRRQEGKLHE